MSANIIQTKAVVTVAEMARMVGLSRARFYQLQAAGVFPPPVYCVATRRPLYVEELQKICLEVRHRNCGINGQPVLFYARRGGSIPLAGKKRKAKAKLSAKAQHAAIAEAIKALGLAAVTDRQIGEAVSTLFPGGTDRVDQAEVIRSVFVYLQRQNSLDNVGR